MLHLEFLPPPKRPNKRKRLPNVNVTIPRKFMRPTIPSKPQLQGTRFNVIRSYLVQKPKINLLRGNDVDIIYDDDTFGYIEEAKNGAKETVSVVLINPDEVKDMILTPQKFPPERSNLVRVTDEGDIVPAVLPDFGDLSLFPLHLKLALKWMFENSAKTPQILKDIWLNCSSVLPSERNEVTIHFGMVRWECHSSSSRLQLLKVAKPESKDIEILIDCEEVSLSHLDGRDYKVTLHSSDKTTAENVCKGHSYRPINVSAVNILVWNCQGVGKQSFKGNLNHLIRGHNPHIVVLLETRLSKDLLKSALRPLHIHRVVGISPPHLYDGSAVLSISDQVQFNAEKKLHTRLWGSLKGQSHELGC